MKKFFVAILILATLLSTLSGCTEKTELAEIAEKTRCVWCCEEAYCVPEVLFGEDVKVCRDCKKDIAELRAELKAAEN